MLSDDIRRLRETFDGWSRGQPFPTLEAWFQFSRDLRDLTFKAAMAELGVDLTAVDVAIEANKPDSRVVRFPAHRTRRPIEPGEGQGS
jgi:hypothetical protein